MGSNVENAYNYEPICEFTSQHRNCHKKNLGIILVYILWGQQASLLEVIF